MLLLNKITEWHMSLINKIIKWQMKSFGKSCAKAMKVSSLTFHFYYNEALSPKEIVCKTLDTRPFWKQIGEVSFRFERGPMFYDLKDLTEYADKQWLTGIINVDDETSVFSVTMDVIRTELYWHNLRDLPVSSRFKFMELSLNAAEKEFKRNIRVGS